MGWVSWVRHLKLAAAFEEHRLCSALSLKKADALFICFSSSNIEMLELERAEHPSQHRQKWSASLHARTHLIPENLKQYKDLYSFISIHFNATVYKEGPDLRKT